MAVGQQAVLAGESTPVPADFAHTEIRLLVESRLIYRFLLSRRRHEVNKSFQGQVGSDWLLLNPSPRIWGPFILRFTNALIIIRLSNAMHGHKFTCVCVSVCLCVRHTFCQLAYRSDTSTDFYSW